MQMKNIISFILILMGASVFAQTERMSVYPAYSNQSLKLRFGVNEYIDYEAIMKYGFTIERKTLIDNNDTLSFEQQQLSKVILTSSLKPKSSQWIIDSLPASDFRNLLKEALYSTAPDTNLNLTAPRLVDAVNKNKQNQGRLFGILYAAEQDFNLARAAALGYIDNSVINNHVYQYYIVVLDSLGMAIINPVILNVSTFNSTSFPPVRNFAAKGKSEAIEISWQKTAETKYSGYDIYRSTDSIAFTKINVTPFVFFKTADVESDEVVFVDSVAPGIPYFYKIMGISPFGSHSDPSIIVKGIALYPRIDGYFVKIPEIVATMTEVPLTWEADSSHNNELLGFNVYRSDFYDGDYIKLNTSIINATARSFTDNNPNTLGYYIVEATDLHDNFYPSSPKMVYLPDSIPPTPPTGLSVQYFGTSKVELKWAENTEEDLAGYRVEFSNHRTGTYVQLTEEFLTGNSYDHYTDPNVVSDSIFFRLFAQDQRGNYSEKSSPIGCKRPDIVPPASPGLSKAMATRQGIELGWSYSPTETVVSYRLERRPKETPSWTTVLSFPVAEKDQYMPTDSTEFNYLDNTQLEYRMYEYRFIAEEENNISASSAPIEVTPLPVVVSNTSIQNFKIEEELVTGSPNRLVQQQINNLKKVNPNSRFSTGVNTQHNIRLTWTYTLDPNLQDFQVFRAISGGNVILYRTITIAEAMGLDPLTEEVIVEEDMGPIEFSILDKDLMTGRRYTYQITARHKDLSSTPRSNALNKKIEAN